MFQEESMKDAYSDEFGVIDFGGGGGGGGCKRKVGMARKVFHTHSNTFLVVITHLLRCSLNDVVPTAEWISCLP